MTEYSKMAKGKFTSSGAAKAIYLPFQPDFVEIFNYTASAAFTDHRVLSAQWDVNMGQGFAITQVKNTTYQTDSVVANGISSFSAGLSFQFGALKQVVSTTKATNTFEVTAHGYSTGDVVTFQGLYSTQFTAGAAQLDGMPFVITVVTADTFTINWNMNQSNFTDLAASPSGAKVKKILYPFLYAPGTAFISALSLSSTTTVTTTAPHNFVAGQEIAFRIPESYGTIELNSLPNSTIPGSPIYGYVTSVTSSTQFVCNINSTGYTTFNTNQLIADVPGLSFPQVVAVGDVNTGGVQISAGSALYPPPVVNSVNTINGPAIQGAFVNNTRQGFIIGAGVCVTDTAAVLVGAASDVIYWRAYLHDLSIP